MNLYSLISNYGTSNKYTKYLNTCAHLFNVVTTIIQGGGGSEDIESSVSNILRSTEELLSPVSNIER
jgi:hypothetical protein